MRTLHAGARVSERHRVNDVDADAPRGPAPDGEPRTPGPAQSPPGVNRITLGSRTHASQPTPDEGAGSPGHVPAAREPILFALLAAVLAFFLVLSPWPLQDKLHAIGHACCAQIPSHTIRFAGHAMPIDARNSGIYSSVIVTIAVLWLAGRRKAALFVNPRVGLVLMILVLAMVFDGFNSLAGTHHLHTFYTDTNNLRVVTGVLAGTALTILVLPLFNLLVWSDPEPLAIAEDFGELTGFLIAALVLIMTLTSAPRSLYYPMSILSIAGLLATITLLNTCIGVVSFRRRNRIASLRAFALPAMAALVVACCEITAIDYWLAAH